MTNPVTATVPVRVKDRDAILQSLRAGVVPRTALHLIQVGRVSEVKALLTDIERIADGGSAIRFIIGEYGSGKTFFLNLVRTVAMEKKLVTAHVDLTPDRRLHATGGQARSLYAELMRNTATRAKPEGGALPSIVERFVTTALTEGRERGVGVELVIRERLAHLSEMVGGYDFAEVIAAYWRGHDSGDEILRSNAIRWLRGEFSTRTDARAALGVRTIIDDANVFDHLKLFARLVRLAGYSGLLICVDELVNLYKLANTQARNANYEQILRILNDSLQGVAVGLAFLLGGTPEFLLDTRRGLYSYPALQSRLAENAFAVGGLADYTGPVLRLANLSPEELYVLLGKLRDLYIFEDPARLVLPDEGLRAFMAHCSKRIGDAYFRTPRTTITAFINLLAILDQNPGVAWTDLLERVVVEKDEEGVLEDIPESATDTSPSRATPADQEGEEEDDELATFRV
jgi:hypothetical protein